MKIDYKESDFAVIAMIAATPDVVFFHGECNKPLTLESSYMPPNFIFFNITCLGKCRSPGIKPSTSCLRRDDVSNWCHN